MAVDSEDSKSPWLDDFTINITRPAYDKDTLDSVFGKVTPTKPPWRQRLRNSIANAKSKSSCSGRCMLQGVLGKFPIIETLRTYSFRTRLLSDFVAGLSVGIMHIPQGMGFALLASLPPVYGLYASFWPVLIYFFFGSCHHLSAGTMALISLMISTAVEQEITSLGLGARSPPISTFGGNKTGEETVVYVANTTYNEMGYGVEGLEIQSNRTLPILDVNSSTGYNFSMSSTSVSEGPDVIAIKVGIAMLVTFMAGVFQLLMGIFKMGIVTTFMPTPFVGGFTTGAACHILTSQVKFLFGMENKRFTGMFGLILNWIDILKSLPTSNPAEIIISVLCITILLVIKMQINERFRSRMKAPVPAELIVVIIGCIVSYFVNISDKFDVKIIGHIPSGIPPPTVPPMDKAVNYIVDAFVIAVISFAVSFSIGSIFANKHKYVIDSNQELFSYGILHIVGSFFGSFAGAGAPPRCVVLDVSGGTSQVAAFFTGGLLLLVILVMGPLFQPLPNSILASIIVVALIPMFQQFQNLKPLWRVNKYDFAIWLVTWATVTFLDVTIGLVIGIGFAIATIPLQAFFAKGFTLGALDNLEVYVPVKDYQNASELEGVKVFRFEGSLHFASKERFKTQLFKAAFLQKDESKNGDDIEKQKYLDDLDNGVSPNEQLINNNAKNETEMIPPSISSQQNGNPSDNDDNETKAETSSGQLRQRSVGSKESLKARGTPEKPPLTPTQSIAESLGKTDGLIAAPDYDFLILDCSCMSYLDLMGLNTLKQVHHEFQRVGVSLALVSCPAGVLKTLQTTGFRWMDGTPMELFPTILDAVVSAKHSLVEEVSGNHSNREQPTE